MTEDSTLHVEPVEEDGANNVLRCSACGEIVHRLHSARETLRSLSLGITIHQGEPICDHCLMELEDERTQENELRGPA